MARLRRTGGGGSSETMAQHVSSRNRAPDRVRHKSIFCCLNYPRTILKESIKLVTALQATKTLQLASAFAERSDCSGAEFIGSSQLQRGMRDRMADVIRSGVTDC